MKIYDISRELFACEVYPGDTKPLRKQVLCISDGASCNLSDVTMSCHNGTHIDAPKHFIDGGKDIASMDLNKTVGEATVVGVNGDITAEDASRIIQDNAVRILFKGKCNILPEAAEILSRQAFLIGVEAQTAGNEIIHRELLSNETVILEGIDLSCVPEGKYFLCATPIKMENSDGAPCRAILIKTK